MTDLALIVAPHHDDEAIGCGGLAARLVTDGWALAILWVFAPIEGTDSEEGEIRLAEAATSARILGARQTESLNHPCRESASELDITWQLVSRLRSLQPKLLLLPHEDERDPEHQLAHRAANEAAWLAESGFRSALGGPAPRITGILGYEIWTPIRRPAAAYDITLTVETKLRAIRAYGSQRILSDYAAGFEGLARYRGVTSGVGVFVESYAVYRNDALPGSLAPL